MTIPGGSGSGDQPSPGRRLRQLAGLSLSVLKGVGPAAEADLATLGLASVLDLLTHYPRRYIDATRLVTIDQLRAGEKASVLGEVVRVQKIGGGYGKGRRSPGRVEVTVADPTGRLGVTFFNQAWRAGQLPPGTLALFFGPVTSFRNALQMTGPQVEILALASQDGEARPDRGRIFPVYPLTEKVKLTSARLGRYVAEALERAGPLADPVPEPWLDRVQLIDRTTALNAIHRPEAMSEVEPARRRLAFDELFRLQLALVLRQRRLEDDARGIRHRTAPSSAEDNLWQQFVAALPFELTNAQSRAIEAIAGDLASPLPMHRLLQGDVGAGKTLVALAAMLISAQGGHQSALMAPTEVLAEQHAAEVARLVDGLSVPDPGCLGGRRPLRSALLTNRTPAGERSRLHDELRTGQLDILVGTHALLVDEVVFHSLGVVVIDEQHRFGVEQRAALRDKGRGQDGTGADPDLLVMTATPIPRTAAMVVFGDLDMTIIDELPPGRQGIATTWLRGRDRHGRAWSRVRDEVAAGHRAFVVCPLVEGSERIEATSAVAEAERLAGEDLAGLRIGLLHGQMKAADKERVMAGFRSGGLDVLVATTVIEVGVDVPEATVMVIEDADRFGIAQLHQLRGRVGRGSAPSYCFLLSDEESSDEATARLEAMERTSDGFELADVDLLLRGEGTILGARQKGRSDLKLARLLSDRDLVAEARQLAVEVVAGDPTLTGHPLLVEELRVFVDDEEAAFLFKS